MSSKRSRAAYEAEPQPSFVLFGTPLPPQDPEVRDDGSFVPIWKQEVRDERGRKRLHGAFTGGWSAGYFNTVGSKEGWAPSTFVSSRATRQKDDAPKPTQQRPEDFMDDEDLANAADAQTIQISDSFAGLGATQREGRGRLADLFHADAGDTMGVKLLQKMGWKQGQGIGPKVRRKARLNLESTMGDKSQIYLFAPENISMMRLGRKIGHMGLGFSSEAKLNPKPLSVTRAEKESESEEDDSPPTGSNSFAAKIKKGKPVRGCIGIGVLNDTGSDDDDPYELGPKISYNKVIGGDKKRKKGQGLGSSGSNLQTKSRPASIVRKSVASRTLRGFRKCHDGHLPITGFVFGIEPDTLITAITSDKKYHPPAIPEGWKPARVTEATRDATRSEFKSTADIARESSLNPVSRAEILGENQLPGKSVFDFLSSSARDRLAAASGKASLPPGLGEIPAKYTLSEEEKAQHAFSQIPKLGKETAIAAMTRGTGPGAPYSEDEVKRGRYMKYLQYHAGYSDKIPSRLHGMKDGDWLNELEEFYSCAKLFKPMTGVMASRFTTSSSTANPILGSSSTPKTDQGGLVSRPATKAKDPAEEAANMGMYGPLTRSVEDFFPTRLLCKRFNVKPPAPVQADTGQKPPQVRSGPSISYYGIESLGTTSSTKVPRDTSVAQKDATSPSIPTQDQLQQVLPVASEKSVPVIIDAGRNEATEGKRAQEELFKAIFGDTQHTNTHHKHSHHNTAQPSPTVDSPPIARLSDSADRISGPPVSRPSTAQGAEDIHHRSGRDSPKYTLSVAQGQHGVQEAQGEDEQDIVCVRPPPPQYPASEVAGSRPPPFDSLYDTVEPAADDNNLATASAAATVDQLAAAQDAFPEGRLRSCLPARYLYRQPALVFHAYDPQASSSSAAAPAYAPIASAPSTFDHPSEHASLTDLVADTKRALAQDPKGESSGTKDDDAEPPPAYSEGDSPLLSFTFVMSAAGGPSSIITQVQQGGPPINAIGDVGADETITMDLRGTRFVLSRDELLTLPEFVLLSLFPNGLFPEGHMGGFGDNDAVQVDYDPASLQYMLEFFRDVAQSIPVESSPEPSSGGEDDNRDDSSKRAGIIVLREDLDFYAIPPRADIAQAEMTQVKRAAAKALLQQNGIFSGLKKSDEPGTTEAHLIEMLTAGGFNHDDLWGHRAGEPNKAVICSLALARLRSDIRGSEMGTNAVGMAQKLLLFWRKPARRCWWEGVELDNVEGVEGQLKVWIRRVWTLEMSVIGLR